MRTKLKKKKKKKEGKVKIVNRKFFFFQNELKTQFLKNY